MLLKNKCSCFLHFLLAGSGSQIIVFDINLGRQIKSFSVFEGVRVHGIASGLMNFAKNSVSASITFKIVISGERRVKLYSLHLQILSESPDVLNVSIDLTFLQLLPRFSHWVLDFCFLEVTILDFHAGDELVKLHFFTRLISINNLPSPLTFVNKSCTYIPIVC